MKKSRINCRRCKDKAKIATYDAKLAELDKSIRAKGKEFLKANDYYNEVLKPTNEETEELKKSAETLKAEKIAAGIKYQVTVYVYPHGIEGEGMDCYNKDCKTLEEVESWIKGEGIPVYTGGIYDAGWSVEDLNGNVIADQTTGLESLTENKTTDFDDGSNDEPEEDFIATLDTSIEEETDSEDELIDEPNIEPPYYSTHRYTYYPKDNPYDGGIYGNYGACFNDYRGYSLVDAVKFVLEDFKKRGGEDNYGGANVVRYMGDEETLLLNFLPNLVEVFDDIGIVQPMVDEFFENRQKEERKHRRNRRTYYEPKVNQPEIDDYAATPEALEVAVQVEIENAAKSADTSTFITEKEIYEDNGILKKTISETAQILTVYPDAFNATVEGEIEIAIKKFEVGKIYQVMDTSFGGYYKVVSRNDDTVTFEDMRHNRVEVQIYRENPETAKVRVIRNYNGEYLLNNNCYYERCIYAREVIPNTADCAMNHFNSVYSLTAGITDVEKVNAKDTPLSRLSNIAKGINAKIQCSEAIYLGYLARDYLTDFENCVVKAYKKANNGVDIDNDIKMFKRRMDGFKLRISDNDTVGMISYFKNISDILSDWFKTNATAEEIVKFELGKWYSVALNDDDNAVPALQLLNLDGDIATFWDASTEIIKGKLTVENGVEIAEIDCPYLGKIFVSATMKAKNTNIDLEKTAKIEGDTQDNITTEEKNLPPLEVWQSILNKSLTEIKAIMKVSA